MNRHWLPALLAAAVLAGAPAGLFADDKALTDARDRMKIEAQRVEKVFAEERAAAYKLVRTDKPNLVEATDKLQALLSMIRKDTSLEARRRKVLLVTLEFDLERIKREADNHRRSSIDSGLAREARSNSRRDTRPRSDEERRPGGGSSVVRDARSIMDSRRRDVLDSRLDRVNRADRFNRVTREVDRSASMQEGLPPDYRERMKKRSTAIKMTAKERAIMAALKTTIDVDFSANSLEEILDWLRKKTGVEIIADKRSLDEVGVKYETQVTKKLRATTRTVLKSILSDLGLAYIVKDEAIQILSVERARQETTTRTYYIGDLAMVANVNIPPLLSKALAIQQVNQLINLISSTVDPKSWQINNPEAPGTITFEPITMSLVVKQTAEFHFLMAGK
jgi:hypothetical protein